MKSFSSNPFLKFEDKSTSVGFKIPDVSMFGMLKISAENNPDAIAYEYFGTRCSYESLVDKVAEVSGAYYALGVRKGDIVTIIMPNTPEAVISIYALNRIGAVSDIIHPLSAEEEIKNYINNVQSKILLCVDLCIEKIKRIIDETPVERVVVTSCSVSMNKATRLLYSLKNAKKFKWVNKDKIYVSWNEFIKCSEKIKEYTPKGDENKTVAVILHSGGTTGEPKGIMLSNSNFNAFGMQSVLTLRDVKAGDKILAVLPVFHGFGLGVCVHVAFCFGACSVLIPKFNAEKFGNIIKKHKPSMLFGVPTLYEALIKAKGVKKLDFSFLKYAVSGGDSLPDKLEKSLNEFFAKHNSNVKICEGYGMTEGLAALCISIGENYKRGTIGKPLIGTEMCIVKPGTVDILNPEEDGELCVCGPTVMLGYRNNEEETKKVLKMHTDGRLWLHTGDMASISEDGFVKYKARIKRMMITSGFNVYPYQIENVVEELDFVEKCVVVAIPHQYKKEVAKAYIVLKDGKRKTETTINEIREYCRKKLMHYCVPYEIEFASTLPKTPYNKIDFMKLSNG